MGGMPVAEEGAITSPTLLDHTRTMRRHPTAAEKHSWRGLRNHKVAGLKFRRQVALGPFIANFYCAAARLAVELDGMPHIGSRTDDVRDGWMRVRGYSAVRFSKFKVWSNPEGVLLAIQQAVLAPRPPNLGPLRGPSPLGEGEFLSSSDPAHV